MSVYYGIVYFYFGFFIVYVYFFCVEGEIIGVGIRGFYDESDRASCKFFFKGAGRWRC